MILDEKTSEQLIKQLADVKHLLRTLYAYSPNMLWVKDRDGRFTWANARAVNVLLQAETLDDVIGLTDVELAEIARVKLGVDINAHTVGEVCANTDDIVIKTQTQHSFIEQFNVNGKLLVLFVTKNVVRDVEGNVTGTVGTAQDVTDLYMYAKKQQDRDDIPDDVIKEMGNVFAKHAVDRHVQTYTERKEEDE